MEWTLSRVWMSITSLWAHKLRIVCHVLDSRQETVRAQTGTHVRASRRKMHVIKWGWNWNMRSNHKRNTEYERRQRVETNKKSARATAKQTWSEINAIDFVCAPRFATLIVLSYFFDCLCICHFLHSVRSIRKPIVIYFCTLFSFAYS